jgi:carbamoylphosphate synthase large subunit
MFKSFKKNGFRVVGCDGNPDAVGQFFADAFYVVPWQTDPGYHDALLKVVQKEKADILVAGEGEAPGLNEIKDEFEKLGCTLVATDVNTLNLALDKTKLFSYLAKHTDIPLPEFYKVESLDDFDLGMKRIKSNHKCIKPAITSGSRGFVILSNKRMEAEEFFNKKTGFQQMMVSEFRDMLQSSSKIPKLILMEYLQDKNYDTTLICKNGEVLFQSVRTREEAKVGTITKGKIVEYEELYEINCKISRALNTTGYISTQFIGNKLIEINPRWSTTLIYKSINEYLMGVKLFTGEKINVDPRDQELYPGVKMIRYWDMLTYKDGEGLVN